jgi:RNA polymerase sigma factor (sigma-70 family)
MRGRLHGMDDELTPQDGEAYFLAHLAEIESAIRSVCHRKRVCGADAEDLEQTVKLKLIDNDYAKLRKFKGESSLFTWVIVVTMRLYIDDRHAKYGKWHPSAIANRSGPLSILLEQLTVRDGYTFDEACEIIQTNYRVDVTREELERRWKALPVRERRRLVSDDVLISHASNDPSPDEIAMRHEHDVEIERLFEALREETQGLESNEDRLIVAATLDGQPLLAVGRLLGYDAAQQKQLFPKRIKLFDRLRKRLADRGFNEELVRENFDPDRLY